jgi:hypothetical protein
MYMCAYTPRNGIKVCHPRNRAVILRLELCKAPSRRVLSSQGMASGVQGMEATDCVKHMAVHDKVTH